jgi:hypothetical protein
MIAAHAPHSVVPIHPIKDPLYVVTAISNPARFRKRYQLYRAFEKHMQDSGVILITVELAFGHRPFEVTETGNPLHVQVRSNEELWLKENLLNIGVAHLPASAKYVAVVDGDLTFTRPDWAHETVQQLQHFSVVQMFESIGYLDNNGRLLNQSSGPSFVENWLRGKPLVTPNGATVSSDLFYHPAKVRPGYPNPGDEASPYIGAPGGAWAFRREAFDAIGGLIDFNILGAADYFMAAGLFGLAEHVIPRASYSPDFQAGILRWQDRAVRAVGKNVGCVPGSVLHSYHGPFADRNYESREKILVKYQFAPTHDLKRDGQHLWQLEDDHTDRFTHLRDDIRSYFRVRNEDAV